MKSKKKVCIMGMGYIGLPIAVLLANREYQVHGVDINQKTIDIINRGDTHIVEPELNEFVYSAIKHGNFRANIKPAEANIFIIAVPTPFHKDKLNKLTNTPIPNINYIVEATKQIASYVKSGNLILLESTSPVGTTDMMVEILSKEGVDTSGIYIAYSPERVLPGQIMKELIENDRVVGGVNSISTKKAAEFYRTFVVGEVAETTAKIAEMTKLTENSFRDVNIAFANELSILCDDMEIDVKELISLANKHPRVNILNPGCGVGGHCISVDPWFIVNSSNGKAQLIEQARQINDFKPDWVLEKIKNALLQFEIKHKKKPTVTCMGLSFKPNVGDLRESPALYIAKKLNEVMNIASVEPNIKEYIGLDLVDIKTGLESDICIYLVNHKEFSTKNMKEADLDFCGINNN